MKKILLSLFILLPALTIAQSEEVSDSTEISSDSIHIQRFKSALKDLLDLWQLGYNTHPATFDIKYPKFITSLTDSAEILNDFDIYYNPKNDSDNKPYKPYSSIKQNGDDFASTINSDFISLQIDTTYLSNPVFSDSNNIVVVTINRKIKGRAKIQYVIKDFSALLDSVINRRNAFYVSNKKLFKSELSPLKDSTFKDSNLLFKNVKLGLDSIFRLDSNKVFYDFEILDQVIVTMALKAVHCPTCPVDTNMLYKVSRIILVGDPIITCTNDIDNDGVVEDPTTKGNDNCPIFGDFTANGCPDYDFDSTPDKQDSCKNIFGLKENCGCPQNFFHSRFTHELFIGGQYNSAELSLPELNKLGYRYDGVDAMDVLQSKKGSLNSSGSNISLMVGANLNAYFGKQKNIGISLGFTYSFFKQTYTVEEPIVYTFKSFDSKDTYRRRVTIKNGSEEIISYNELNIPLLFKIRWMNENIKWQYQLGIGPSYLMFRNSSNYNVNINFEGLYQIDTNVYPHIYYDDYFDPTSNLNVYLLGDSISSYPAVVDAVFDSLRVRGYDFKMGNNYIDKKSKVHRNTIALNVMFDVSYKLTNRFAVKLGFHFVYAPMPADSKSYIPIDKTTDTYNSLYNSKAKSNYFVYGINAGFIFNMK